jgi:hypothetical protein
LIFFDQKWQFTYLHKGRPSFRRTSSTSKHEISFSNFVGHFCSPGSGSGNCNLLIPIKGVQATAENFFPALQNMKFLNFYLFLWVTIAPLDPDPLA